MYWSDQNSGIDALLSQEGVTLETILNEDDVLQECRSPNKALLEFLCKEENLTTMLSVITSEPTETTNEMERFKNANLICEIFTYEGNPFIEIIVNNDKFMTQLWSFVSIDTSIDAESEQPTTLNPLLASFFTKVFLHLFTHKLDMVMDFLGRQEPPNDFVSIILRHINVSAIMDLMFKTWEYVQMDRKNGNFSKYNEILEKNNFIEKLISVFGDKDADLKQTNVANLVSDLVKTGREFLIRFPNDNSDDKEDEKKEVSEIKVEGVLLQFEKTEVSRDLLQKMFAAQTKYSIASGLKIIQDLLVYRMQMEQLMKQQQNAHLPPMNNGKTDVQQDISIEEMPTFLKASSSPSPSDCQFMPPQLLSPIDVHGEHLARCVRNVSIALHERLDDFVALLTNPSGLAPITTTVGVINCPLGLIRVEVIHLFVALFATSDYSILEKCSQLHILKHLTDLFFEYSHNNQLHKYYEQIIEYLFQNYSNFKTIYNKYKSNEVQIDKSDTVVSTDSALPAVSNSTENSESAIFDVKEKETEEASSEPQEMDTLDNNSAEESNKLPNNEKILYFEKLYEISQVLVKQVIGECRLIEKILDSYANEKVPVKSKKNQPQTALECEEKQASEASTQELYPSSSVKEEPSGVEKMEVDPEVPIVPNDTCALVESLEVKVEKGDEALPKAPQATVISKRPGYMGHLRLIANVLKDRCPQELLEECELSADVLQRWAEFKSGKLSQLNELINNKLVEEKKYSELFCNEDMFNKYPVESVVKNLASRIPMFASEFSIDPFDALNDSNQIKVTDPPEFDFEKYWNKSPEKLNEFEKYFDEKCSSIFDDDDDDAFKSNESSLGVSFKDDTFKNIENPLGVSFKKERPTQLTRTMQEDFASFEDPFLSKEDESKADFEAGFANFEQMSSSTTNPWGEESASDNAVADSDGTVQMVTVQSSDWADFSNSCPFDDNPPEEGTKTELNQLFESISGDSPKEEPLEH